MGEATWSISELDQREKAFACLAADVCLRDLGLPFQMHVQMAMANDVPLGHIREVLLQAAIEAGHTGALLALQRFKELCREFGETYPSDAAGASSDMHFDYFDASSVFGNAELKHIWRTLMPPYWSRGGLSLKERAYVSLTCNVLQGTLGAPFDHHVRLAKAAGARSEQIRALFLFLSEYGFSRSWAALDAFANLKSD
jgi:alkylhydroperoxidase/carboxymuconolactone decarboxylase family protein YurZ